MNAEDMYSYGYVLAETRDWADAETALRKSIVMDGKAIESHELLASVLKSEGKTAEARKEQQLADFLKTIASGNSADIKKN